MNDNETLAFRHGSFDSRGTVICPHIWRGVELCRYVSSTYIIGLPCWRYCLIALRQTILRALILQRSTITCLLSLVFFHLKETFAVKLFRNF
jgi:hypothetical protein